MDDQIEERDTTDLVHEAYEKARREDATPADGKRFRALLRKHPEELSRFTDALDELFSETLEKVTNDEATAAVILAQFDKLKADLGHECSSQAERLLIDQVALNLLNLWLVQKAYAQRMYESFTLSEGSFWERRVSMAQHRYLRSIETLARVRKLMGVPMLQINIAAEGGQQVVSNA